MSNPELHSKSKGFKSVSAVPSKPQLLSRNINMMGTPLKQYKWKSCVAEVAEGEGWATICSIMSVEQGKGHATEMLKLLKHIYRDTKFGGSVALNDTMRHLYKKIGITEYSDDYKADDPVNDLVVKSHTDSTDSQESAQVNREDGYGDSEP